MAFEALKAGRRRHLGAHRPALVTGGASVRPGPTKTTALQENAPAMASTGPSAIIKPRPPNLRRSTSCQGG